MIGYYRKELGKSYSKKLRAEAQVPCVMYGKGDGNIHFYSPMALFKNLVYTSDVYMVDMNIEGDMHKCILQDIQYHPVSEIIMHADFLELSDDKEVQMEVPVKFEGASPGMLMGGKLVTKQRKLKVKAFPKDMPDFITVSIEGLELGKSVKVGSVEPENYTILNNPLVTIATIEVPRALKGKGAAAGEAE